jgi:hypothetical protein
MKEKFIHAVLNYRFILGTYLLLALLVVVQCYALGESTINGFAYTHFNNYIIFKQSFFHLLHHQDLYTLYLPEHFDYYKYSPTFALFMAPLAVLPDFMGLFLWNLLNVVPLFLAIRYFPNINETTKKYILWFVVLELITSLQNSQSNGLVAGLLILAFLLLERNQFFWGILLIVFSAYIKIFGIVGLALLLVYPNKIRNSLYTLFWGILLFLLPLIVVSPHQLQFLYSSWKNLLSFDASQSVGLSVGGWLQTWFNVNLPKSYILVPGIILFCIPLLRIKFYKDFYFRVLLLSSVLLWIVIFNHKAESPTFIIAICGVALWYFPQARKTENLVLLIVALIFTMLSPTDLFPPFVRNNFFKPYVIKAVPCILIWLKLMYDMMFYKTPDALQTQHT